MSKDQAKDITSLVGAGSSSGLLIVALFAWQQLSDIKGQLATHISQTNTLIQRLETRIENLEKRVGEIKADIR